MSDSDSSLSSWVTTMNIQLNIWNYQYSTFTYKMSVSKQYHLFIKELLKNKKIYQYIYISEVEPTKDSSTQPRRTTWLRHECIMCSLFCAWGLGTVNLRICDICNYSNCKTRALLHADCSTVSWTIRAQPVTCCPGEALGSWVLITTTYQFSPFDQSWGENEGVLLKCIF